MDPEIVLVREPLAPARLRTLVDRWFGDMVKYVADVDRGVLAVGGELHADAEAVLLADGSRQADLWGANYYPGRGEAGCIEYTSLINIRPAAGNRSMEIGDEAIRARVRELTFALLGRGGELP
jgi:selenocysteine lyase/cysteine desulfurase